MWHDSYSHVWKYFHMCVMTRSCVYLDSFLCVPCPLHMCAITSSYVYYDSFLLSSMTHSYVFHDSFIRVTNTYTFTYIRLTQSKIYVPIQANRFQKIDLRIVQYKYLRCCSKQFVLQNLILRTKFCGTRFITQPSCVFDFRLTNLVICIIGVPVLNRHFGGAGP